MMRSAVVGLFAIPIIIALVTMMGGSQACVGGDPAHTYFEKTMDVTAGNYSAKPFTVDKDEPHLEVGFKDQTKVYILSDAQMANFQSGKEFKTEFNSSNTSMYIHSVNLTKGKYWTVVDNRASTTPLSDTITVERLAMKGCGDASPVSSLPEFQGYQVVITLVIATGIAFIVKRSRAR